MPESPTKEATNNRLCDFCSETTGVVYCRADTAKLCLSCDIKVHSTNLLFTKHTRFLLCDACDSSPATIFCCTQQSVLCQNCDYDIHRMSATHDRRPLDGFTGCPSVLELSVAVGVEGFDVKCCQEHDLDLDLDLDVGGFLEEDGCFVWDDLGIVTIDELIDSTDKDHSFTAIAVPSLPKDRNSSCGQHKQEILRQLTELAKVEPIINRDSDPLDNLHFEADENQDDFIGHRQEEAYQHEEGHPILKGNEARTCSWGNDGINGVNDVFLSPWMTEINFDESGLNSDAKSGICGSVNQGTTECNSQIPIGSELTSAPPKIPSHEFTAADRVSAVSRYKEKKRTRRFEKHIRYESRKLQAENRTRVKGRFAKMDNKAV